MLVLPYKFENTAFTNRRIILIIQHEEKARECEHKHVEVCYSHLTATTCSNTHLVYGGPLTYSQAVPLIL